MSLYEERDRVAKRLAFLKMERELNVYQYYEDPTNGEIERLKNLLKKLNQDVEQRLHYR